MSDQTTTANTTTTNTTTTPQVDEVAVEPAVESAAASVQAEKSAEAPAAVSDKDDSENKQVEDQPKMDVTETPPEKETKPAEATEKPVEDSEKPVGEAADKQTPVAAAVGSEAGDKPAADQPPKPAEPVNETSEDVKPVIEAGKVVEAEKVADEKKAEQEKAAAAGTEEKAMKVDEEPTKEVETAPAPEQPQPPKQNDLPTRQYLDATVVPILHSALSQLAKIRPDDPIQYLCKFLQEQKSNYAPESK